MRPLSSTRVVAGLAASAVLALAAEVPLRALEAQAIALAVRLDPAAGAAHAVGAAVALSPSTSLVVVDLDSSVVTPVALLLLFGAALGLLHEADPKRLATGAAAGIGVLGVLSTLMLAIQALVFVHWTDLDLTSWQRTAISSITVLAECGAAGWCLWRLAAPPAPTAAQDGPADPQNHELSTVGIGVDR